MSGKRRSNFSKSLNSLTQGPVYVTFSVFKTVLQFSVFSYSKEVDVVFRKANSFILCTLVDCNAINMDSDQTAEHSDQGDSVCDCDKISLLCI